jgi:hypothetical protein
VIVVLVAVVTGLKALKAYRVPKELEVLKESKAFKALRESLEQVYKELLVLKALWDLRVLYRPLPILILKVLPQTLG